MCIGYIVSTWTWSVYMMTSSNGNIFGVTGHLCAQRPVTWSFNVFFDLRLNKRLSKQTWGWWLETQSHPLWRHCNEDKLLCKHICGEWKKIYSEHRKSTIYRNLSFCSKLLNKLANALMSVLKSVYSQKIHEILGDSLAFDLHVVRQRMWMRKLA